LVDVFGSLHTTDYSTVLTKGFIILLIRVDYSAILAKGFIILPIRVDYSTVLAKGFIIIFLWWLNHDI